MIKKFKYCPFCATKLKKDKCPKCHFVNYENPKPTVVAIIIKDNKLLLTKRAIKPFFGKWDLPGGFIHKNEDPETALKREMKEELGVSIKIKKFLGFEKGIYNDSNNGLFNTIGLYYLVEIKDKPRAKSEISEIKFLDLDKIPKLAFSCDQKAVENFKNEFEYIK